MTPCPAQPPAPPNRRRQDRGFVYVATGAGYVDEACRSAASLRRHHPGVPICLITDQEPSGAPAACFSDILRPSRPVQHGPIDKLLAIDAPYERCIFLDSDTWIVGDLGSLFDLLDRFDLAALQDVHRGWNYEIDVPSAFSEFNTGVVAFRNDARVADFFAAWRTSFDEMYARQHLVTDQPAFRRALYYSQLRIAPVPSEFHFLANVPNCTMWDARLLHGRGDLAAAASLVNEQMGARVYVPDVGTLTSYHGRLHGLRAAVKTAARLLRLVTRRPVDVSSLNPNKWWLTPGTPATRP